MAFGSQTWPPASWGTKCGHLQLGVQDLATLNYGGRGQSDLSALKQRAARLGCPGLGLRLIQ